MVDPNCFKIIVVKPQFPLVLTMFDGVWLLTNRAQMTEIGYQKLDTSTPADLLNVLELSSPSV